MRIDPSGLSRLGDLAATQPHPIWLLTGDDPVLMQSARIAVRDGLARAGITEREAQTTDRSFDWQGWLSQGQAGSLFAERRLVELTLPTGKPGVSGGKALVAWASAPPEGVVLVVSMPAPDRTQAATPWFKALCAAGERVEVPSLGLAELARWIQTSLQAEGLTIEPEALRWAAEQCENNSAAAQQLITKLSHLPRAVDAGPVGRSELEGLLTDQARFSAFAAGDLLLQGPLARSLRMLRGLRDEGEPLPLILWSVSQAARRLPEGQSGALLSELARIDTMIKGLSRDDPWLALERIALRLHTPRSPIPARR